MERIPVDVFVFSRVNRIGTVTRLFTTLYEIKSLSLLLADPSFAEDVGGTGGGLHSLWIKHHTAFYTHGQPYGCCGDGRICSLLASDFTAHFAHRQIW